MSAAGAIAGVSYGPGPGAGFARWAASLLPAKLRLLRQSTTLDETVLATFGLVQVRRTRLGAVARTVVKGECGPALQIALARLANYAAGDNREGLSMPAAWPVVQRPGGPGRWLVQIGLPGEHAPFAAPVPYNRKIRILPQSGETLAVMRLPGQPRTPAIARGGAAILAAIAGSGWIATGTPVLRLHVLPGLLPWFGGFEVAVPVTTT
jgi:SOUL heme-binding protein